MKLEKVQATVVNHFCAKYEVALEADVAKTAKALQAKIKKKLPNDELADCDQCGGVGPIAEPVCVFCGVGDSTEATTNFAAEIARHRREGTKPKTHDANQKEAKDAKRKPRSAAKASTAAVEVSADEAAERLKASLKRYNELKVEGSKNYWDMAVVVSDIYEHATWKTMRDGKGKALYPSWNQFVKTELGTSVVMAHKMVDVAKNFDAKDFMVIGVSKLDLMLRLPPPKRERLMAEMRERPVSVKELTAKLAKLGAKSKGDGATGKTREATQVTGVFPVKQQWVPLIAKPGKDIVSQTGPKKPAKSIQAKPVGKLVLNNGVTVHFELVAGKVGWELLVKAER